MQSNDNAQNAGQHLKILLLDKIQSQNQDYILSFFGKRTKVRTNHLLFSKKTWHKNLIVLPTAFTCLLKMGCASSKSGMAFVWLHFYCFD